MRNFQEPQLLLVIAHLFHGGVDKAGEPLVVSSLNSHTFVGVGKADTQYVLVPNYVGEISRNRSPGERAE